MGIEINTNHSTTNSALGLWGPKTQLEILQEEAGEVVTAISRFKRGRTDADRVAEEIADVIVSCMSVIPAFGIEDRVKSYMLQKISRLQGRIDEAEREE